ncbi:MAG: GSCFA domain-containing protein [Muribaculaceae bacterium]|nr:GSCFA domain-containing protein [Muribaculaceae bacterium]
MPNKDFVDIQFRTRYTPQRAGFTLSPQCPVVMLGSCFSDNMAGRMRSCLWNASNPLGTLYNPLSIRNALELFLFEEHFIERFSDSLFTDSTGKCRSFSGDFRLAACNETEALGKAEKTRNLLRGTLQKAQALFITFGTSICYSLLPEKESTDATQRLERAREALLSATVANCHKLPPSRFERYRLTIAEITEIWILLCKKIRETYPQLQIVFTVSPVRHLKDGFVANSRSKAILQLAVEEICSQLEFCSYFPAYEILNDDLRDYRFYASDLAHPSEMAVDYIWEIFKETYLNEEGKALLKEGEKIVKGYRHRSLLMTTQEQAAYMEKMSRRLREFIARHPGLIAEIGQI